MDSKFISQKEFQKFIDTTGLSVQEIKKKFISLQQDYKLTIKSRRVGVASPIKRRISRRKMSAKAGFRDDAFDNFANSNDPIDVNIFLRFINAAIELGLEKDVFFHYIQNHNDESEEKQSWQKQPSRKSRKKQ